MIPPGTRHRDASLAHRNGADAFAKK